MMITNSNVNFMKGKISDDRWDRLLPESGRKNIFIKIIDLK